VQSFRDTTRPCSTKLTAGSPLAVQACSVSCVAGLLIGNELALRALHRVDADVDQLLMVPPALGQAKVVCPRSEQMTEAENDIG